jgi:hypothetical protein
LRVASCSVSGDYSAFFPWKKRQVRNEEPVRERSGNLSLYRGGTYADAE